MFGYKRGVGCDMLDSLSQDMVVKKYHKYKNKQQQQNQYTVNKSYG